MRVNEGMRKTLGMRWSIVLSGGEGERLRPWVEALLGKPRPKQYCSFLGRSTRLEHAAARLSESSRRMQLAV